MADTDSTIQGLPSLNAPGLEDYLLGSDTSDAYEPKKIPLSAAMELILNSSSAFHLQDDSLFLKQDMNTNGHKITGLAIGSAESDAVRFSQVKPLIRSLSDITPQIPSLQDHGSFIRIACATITDPFGGFYLFYWCVDDNTSTTMTMEGGNVIASSGATVQFDGSVANIVNVIKPSSLVGKYFHVAVRYRNLVYPSNISPTGHLHVVTAAPVDIVDNSTPPAPMYMSLGVEQNRLYIGAREAVDVPFGCTYIAQILFNMDEVTDLYGDEQGLITLHSSKPVFTYDLPLLQAMKPFVHARMLAIALNGKTNSTDTLHTHFSFDANVFNDEFINFMAARMSERIQTQAGEPLSLK